MSKEYVSSFGRFDGWVARRLLRRGPDEIVRMYDNPSPLMRAIVEYKWRQKPDVKLARELNRVLKFGKILNPEGYDLTKKVILDEIKSYSKGDLAGYRKFVKLIDNPNIGKNYESFVSDLAENSPKTRNAIIKLSERDEELSKFGLDYRADYIVNDSKIADIIMIRALFLGAFCKNGTSLWWSYFLIYLGLQSDKAQLEFAKILWPDNENMVGIYQAYYDEQYELYDAVSTIYQDTVEEVRRLYEQTEKEIDKKYQGIAKYKELIRTKQLSPFKKK